MRNGVSLFVVVAMLMTVANAKNYIVGDANGWSLGVNYTTWASSKTFRVGDTLEFIYTLGRHSVLHVSKLDYDSCNIFSPIASENSGHTIVTFYSAGSANFICGGLGHCQQGMKFVINVMSNTASSASEFKFSFLGTFAAAIGSMMMAFF